MIKKIDVLGVFKIFNLKKKRNTIQIERIKFEKPKNNCYLGIKTKIIDLYV